MAFRTLRLQLRLLLPLVLVQVAAAYVAVPVLDRSRSAGSSAIWAVVKRWWQTRLRLDCGGAS